MTIADKISRLEGEGQIDLANIDLTIQNGDRLRETAGHLLAYAEGVEIEVPTTTATIRTLLPNRTEELERFITIWDFQEYRHGELLQLVLQAADITPMATRAGIPSAVKLAGALGKLSPGMHDMAEFAYLFEAALAEKETFGFYYKSGKILEGIGEKALARTIVRPIRDQEAFHLDIYDDAARLKWVTLNPMQRYMAREFITRTALPVGVRSGRGNQQRRIDFGRTAVTLMGEDVAAYTDPVEKLGAEILGVKTADMPQFLRKRYEECIEEYQESEKLAA